MTKLILTDADGVLFDWVSGFKDWAQKSLKLKLRADYNQFYTIEKWFGLTRNEADAAVNQYNSSAAMCFLPAYEESVKYIKKLNTELGYRFVVITAMGTDPYAEKARWINLHNLFGDVFDALHVTDLCQCKGEYLSQYESAIWIEDHPENAEKGLLHGHRTYLFNHSHNSKNPVSKEITRVRTWKELYESILVEEEFQVIPLVGIK